MPCSLWSTAQTAAASFGCHSKQCALPSTMKTLSNSEPITTQTSRKASEGTHTENNFPNWGNENFFWANGPPIYAPKNVPESAPKNAPKTAPKNAPKIHAEKNQHLPAASKQKFGRNFWNNFSPNRLDCLADPMEPFSVPSKTIRVTNLRIPECKP